jgi:hypothetical protein
MYEWSLAGEPLPAFKYLTSPEWRAVQDNSVQIMNDYMAMMEKQSSNGSSASNDPKEKERRALEAFGS